MRKTKEGLWVFSKSDAIGVFACSELAASQGVATGVSGWSPKRGNAIHAYQTADARQVDPVRVPGVSDEMWKEADEAYHAYRYDHPLPDRSLILSAEEDRVTEPLRWMRIYDEGGPERPNFLYIIPGHDFAISGARDLVHISPDGTTLTTRDLKSADYMSDREQAIEAAWYVVPSMVEYPGFEWYEVVQDHVAEGTTTSIGRFAAGDFAAVLAFVVATVEEVMRRLAAPVPTLNRRCSGCPLRHGCPEHAKALDVPTETRPVVSMSLAEIEAVDGRMLLIQNAVKGRRSELAAEQKARLASGPVVEGGEEWYLAEKTTRYDVPAGLAAELLAADEVAEKITQEEFAECFSVSRPAVLKLKKKVPETVAAIEAVSVRRKGQTVKHRPATCIIDHVPAADREFPPILSAAAGAPPITVGAPDPEGAVVGSIPPAETSEDGAPLPLSPPAPGCAAPDITHTVDEPGQVAGDPITDAAPAVVAQSAAPQSVADSSPAPGRAPCGIEGCEYGAAGHVFRDHTRENGMLGRKAPRGWRTVSATGAWRVPTEEERLAAMAVTAAVRGRRPRCPSCDHLGRKEKGTDTYLCPTHGAYARPEESPHETDRESRARSRVEEVAR